ncbi:cytochrome c oxidase subunit 3 family protein [Agrobacterium tumefaciens]|uniref:cytochrome c oxidase subunit 3 n=1 Tax=Agrobacterium tumefaciens TaxID=358 RepID=UPI0012B73450|nr:cytochrome c oxidase subunit 3 [Agrobacterium tumefaciens]MQB07880.1 cytochrome c oxidase subunit 3 family protein [Agrobacterium tumefaciens]
MLDSAQPRALSHPPFARTEEQHGQIPGEPGLWVFLFGDMAIFLVFFVSYLFERAAAPALFASSSAEIGVMTGLVNTIILLTSSLLVAVGVNAMRGGANRLAGLVFTAALVCGLVFVTLKTAEYVHLVQAGNGQGSNLYYTYFFILTGIHLMHVLIGFVVLGMMITTARRSNASSDRDIRLVESCACYWHLVDLLWMVIFPLLYLLR